MNALRGRLPSLSALALVVGLTACGGENQQTQPNTPTVGESTPPSTAQEYGNSNEQGPAQPSNEMGRGAGTPSSSAMPSQGAPPEGSTMGGSQGGSQGGAQGGQSGAPQGGSMGNPSSMAASPMDLAGMTDAQMAAVLHAMNTGEMQSAQLAETKATSPEVKKFAHDMDVQHRAMELKANAAFQKANITPSENAVSQQLASDAQNEQSMLQGVTGKDFDRDYMDAQVKNHTMALDMVDKMVTTAKDAQMKGLLQDLRPKIDAHLKEAKRVQSTLQKGSTSKQPSDSDQSPQPARPPPAYP
jgi:putative membrane protein